MLHRMQKQRLTISVDEAVAARVRQCGARHGVGGASGYLERLVRQDETREAADAMGRWYARRPELLDHDESERVAVAGELGETA
jgi:hypothetical protein